MTRLLVAGTGLIGARHLAFIQDAPDLDLVGIIDPDPSRRAVPGVPGFASIDACDAHADGIVIATPTETHLPLTLSALDRGWHVLVEKPIADTTDAADQMIAAARSAGVALLVGHHRRYHPAVEKLHDTIASGAIGRPVVAQLMWCMRKPDAYFDIPWRAGMNGAPVKQNLIHDVDTLRSLFGDVTHVTGLGANDVRGAARTESGGVLLRMSSGVLVTIAFSDATPTPWGFEAGTGESPAIPRTGQDSLRIAGTLGAVEFPSLTLWQGAESWHEAPIPKRLPVDDDAPLGRQLSHFTDVNAGRAEPRVSGTDGRAALEAILRIEAATLPPALRHD